MPAPVVAGSCGISAFGLARLTSATWRLVPEST
jgi:hypothetical protein